MKSWLRIATLSLLGLIPLVITSCGELNAEPPNERAGASVAAVLGPCRSVGLRATKTYSPPLWVDTERSVSAPSWWATRAITTAPSRIDWVRLARS
jgi:hypothetical protein